MTDFPRAAADFLMGVYLLVVACKDVQFRGSFNQHALHWIQSHGCQANGLLAVLSSEVSIFVLTYLSVERYVMLVHPYSRCQMSVTSAALSMVGLWAAGLLLAALPLLGVSPEFYASNTVCFPLHLHAMSTAGSWRFSAVVFVGINGVALVVISYCYVAIFRSIQQVCPIC
jgi:leucine-rich repeat-containing G protein-coupled receptor 7